MNWILNAQRLLAAAVGVAMAANGIAMLFAGPAWYGAVPGVTETGPFNPHFVKDIGAAYLVAGGGLLWFGLRPSLAARGAALAGMLFLSLHALIHLAEAVGDPNGAAHLGRDFAGVFLPPLLGMGALWPVTQRKESTHA
jgi:hypothetical protein